MLTVLVGQTLGYRPGGRAVVPRGRSSRAGVVLALDTVPGKAAGEGASVQQAIGAEERSEQWVALAMRERYPILRDISLSIETRRTIEEAELALKLESEYRADPTLFEDIDFAALIARIDADRRPANVERIAKVLSEEELAELSARWTDARKQLDELLPMYSNRTSGEEDPIAAAGPEVADSQ